MAVMRSEQESNCSTAAFRESGDVAAAATARACAMLSASNAGPAADSEAGELLEERCAEAGAGVAGVFRACGSAAGWGLCL